jgi:hypothetical protein
VKGKGKKKREGGWERGRGELGDMNLTVFDPVILRTQLL